MADFKVGDEVIVSDLTDFFYSSQGTVTQVKLYRTDPDRFFVVFNGRGGAWYGFHQLRLAETAERAEPDMVEHPPHYNAHPKGIECIDIIEDNPYILLGNAMKYLWRVSWGGKSNDLEDLKKAVWCVQREIKRRETSDGRIDTPSPSLRKDV